jgi:hypothetical protein
MARIGDLKGDCDLQGPAVLITDGPRAEKLVNSELEP